MNPFTTLIKRELWENQSLFVYVPIGISLFMVLLLLLSLFVMNVEIGGDVEFSSKSDWDHHEVIVESAHDGADGMPIRELFIAKIKQLASDEADVRRENVNKVLQILNTPLRLVLILVMFYYLMGCLYEERKNRSILFWKSMPVSDLATIGSKLMSALIVAPIIFFICMLLTDICALGMTSILAVMGGVPVWSVLWSGAIGYWFSLPLIFIIYVCWALPIIGWVLFVSSFAKSIPTIWVIGIPIGVIIAEAILFGSAMFRDFITRHASMNMSPGTTEGFPDIHSMIALTMNLDMLLGLVVGLVFIFASVWKRGGSDEI